MAESTLSLSYPDIQVEVGQLLGYDVDPDNWSAGETAEVDRFIQAGYRQFLYPPAIGDIEAGYEWSFIRPTTTIATVASDAEQDMTDDFGRIVGDFHFDADVYAQSITIVSEHRIQSLLQQNDDESRPRYASIRFKASDGSDGQRQEVVWWPIPDDAYTLTYRYEAFTGKLTTGNPYPLGGMKHSEVIVESCLAIAEQRMDDEVGFHSALFGRMLSSAIAQDRKNGARYFGAMSLGESAESDGRSRRFDQSSYDITYKGDTW